MSIMTWLNKQKTDETVRKLVDLAGGDLELVSRAIRAVRQDDKPADLGKVVSYIVRQRRAPSVHEQRAPAHA